MVDVLIGAGTFTSASSFGTQSLQFVTMNELKKSVSGGLYFFYFLLDSSIVSTFCWNLKLLHTRQCLWEVWANESIYSAGVSGQEKLRVRCQLGVLKHAKPLRCTRFLGRLHFAL